MISQVSNDRSYLGFGLGLRTKHYRTILDEKPAIDWLEILTENYLVPGGKPLHFLDRICKHYPMVMHGVSLSIGSTDPLDTAYLKKVKQLADRVEARWISDHLCWTGISGTNLHDLMPVPYTDESLNHVVDRISQVQDFLGRQILIENPSSYLEYKQSTITEWEFMHEMANQADCLILLDVNNIYVSSINHSFDPIEYINAMPGDRVQQIHLAGHSNVGTHIIDTHDQAVIDPVWELYKMTIQHCGQISTMIERDDNIPPLSDLLEELDHARQISESVSKGKAA